MSKGTPVESEAAVEVGVIRRSLDGLEGGFKMTGAVEDQAEHAPGLGASQNRHRLLSRSGCQIGVKGDRGRKGGEVDRQVFEPETTAGLLIGVRGNGGRQEIPEPSLGDLADGLELTECTAGTQVVIQGAAGLNVSRSEEAAMGFGNLCVQQDRLFVLLASLESGCEELAGGEGCGMIGTEDAIESGDGLTEDTL